MNQFSNDVFPLNEGSFLGVRMTGDVILGKYAPKLLKVDMDSHCVISSKNAKI